MKTSHYNEIKKINKNLKQNQEIRSHGNCLNISEQQMEYLNQLRYLVLLNKNLYCVKSVRIRSFSGPYFPTIGPNAAKYRPEKLLIHTLFS